MKKLLELKKLKSNKELLILISTFIVATIELSGFLAKYTWAASTILLAVLLYLRLHGSLNKKRLYIASALLGLLLMANWITYLQDRGESLTGRSKLIKRINRLISFAELELDRRINLLQRLEENDDKSERILKSLDKSLIHYGSSLIKTEEFETIYFEYNDKICKRFIAELVVKLDLEVKNHLKNSSKLIDSDFNVSNTLIENKAMIALKILGLLPSECKKLEWYSFALKNTEAKKSIVASKTPDEIKINVNKYMPILKKLGNNALFEMYNFIQDYKAHPGQASRFLPNERTFYIEYENLFNCDRVTKNFESLIRDYVSYQYYFSSRPDRRPGMILHSKGLEISRLKSFHDPDKYELKKYPKYNEGVICEIIFRGNEIPIGFKMIRI